MLRLLLFVALVVGARAECGRPEIAPHEGSNRLTELLLSKVVGGREAIEGSWPWQVQMKVYNSHYCGGIIIDEDWVMTAAHCVDQYSSTSPWRLNAGSHNKNSNDPQQQERRVSQIKKHQSYDYWSIDNDIALMKVSQPWDFDSRYVGAVCLPDRETGQHALTDGRMLYTTGFGSVGTTCCNNKLKQAMVPYVTLADCRRAYGTSQVTDQMVCAGYYANGGHDACQGDSGGPLVAKGTDGLWYAYGIVSWGNGCALQGYPGVYTRVQSFLSWIQSNTRN